MSSVDSRLSLWGNFAVQFSYNPLFGDIAVDRLTTGSGTYVHSVIMSLLTHLGIIGFILFFLYLFKSFKSILDYGGNVYFNNMYALYCITVFVGMFLIASLSTFFTWSPIWLLMGLIFPPIVFKNKEI